MSLDRTTILGWPSHTCREVSDLALAVFIFQYLSTKLGDMTLDAYINDLASLKAGFMPVTLRQATRVYLKRSSSNTDIMARLGGVICGSLFNSFSASAMAESMSIFSSVMDYWIGGLSGFIIAWFFRSDFFLLSRIARGLNCEDPPGGKFHKSVA